MDTREGAPICRWILEDIVVDIMPTSARVLGFTNSWYAEAMAHATRRELEPGLSIRVVTPPYFIATKLEAFADRGKGDFVASHDLEDIIAVIDGHEALVDEVAASSGALREYLAEQLGVLLQDDEFLAALPGHLAGDAASQSRRPVILARMKALTHD